MVKSARRRPTPGVAVDAEWGRRLRRAGALAVLEDSPRRIGGCQMMAGSETKWRSCLHQNQRMSFTKEIWPWHSLGRSDIPIEACRSPARLRRGFHCICRLDGSVAFRTSMKTAMLQKLSIQERKEIQRQKGAIHVKLVGSIRKTSTSSHQMAQWQAFANPMAPWRAQRNYGKMRGAGASTLRSTCDSATPIITRTSASRHASKMPAPRTPQRTLPTPRRPHLSRAAFVSGG